MPELYGAVHEGESDVPLMMDGRSVFFTDPARAPELIQFHGGVVASDKMDVEKPSFWCDVAKTLQLLSAGGILRSRSSSSPSGTLRSPCKPTT